VDIFEKSKETVVTSRNPAAQIAFRYRAADSPAGVTRGTARRLAKALGVDETQAIHLALREMALRVLPQYAADEGPLTTAQTRQVRKLAGKIDTSRLRSSLFGSESG
jgi:hypothetical protein